MADVFVSYARGDELQAKYVAAALRNAGYSVWRDEELPAHRIYAEVIEERLSSAKAVVVLWSARAAKSHWVRSEADAGRAAGKLVQATLDGRIPPMPFDQIQCADLQGWTGNEDAGTGWRKLITSVEALAHDPSSPDAAQPATALKRGERGLPRRVIVVGTAATLGAAGIAGAWMLFENNSKPPPVKPETRALLQQAKVALWQMTPEGQNQALGLYHQVVSDNPEYADGWASLSVAYAWTAHFRRSAEATMLRDRALASVQRARSLDPENRIAMVGEATARPIVGNWSAIDLALRKAVSGTPMLDELGFQLAIFLAASGRATEALRYINIELPEGPTPGIYFAQSQILWSAGRTEELDNLFTKARELYPTHFGLWFARFHTDMFGGRPDHALALAANRGEWPTGIDSEEIERLVKVAKAIESPSKAALDAVVEEWRELAHHGAGYAENATEIFAALGRTDDAFTVLRAYYFSEGFDCGEVRFKAAQGTYTAHNDRLTAFLFNPALKLLRNADGRFLAIVGRLGLTKFWNETGDPPDFQSANR